MSKLRTITLTGRAPVRIDEDAWPVVARAKTWDNTYESQANRDWLILVREHSDGRRLVYGVHTSAWQGEPDLRAGYLTDTDGTPAAIRDVAEEICAPEHLAAQCIADLPPEVLD